ncbi:MAG: hypothetical protein H7Z13_12000, partial [Ferruginibacter sp.]|nr:hypothetical protein [Ferruginibacter sp.]
MKKDFGVSNFRFFLNCFNPKIFFLAIASCSAMSVNAQSIIRTDFNREKPWHADYRKNEKWNDVAGKTSSTAVTTHLKWGRFGVVDVAYTTVPSEALQLTAKNATNQRNWTAGFNSGLVPVKNNEALLGKLTLSFDHSLSSVHPLLMRIESFDTNKKRTGGLEKKLYPATANHFVRAAFELVSMNSFGEGRFNPKDAFVNFFFEIEGDASDSIQLRIDNVSYATPAYYVSPSGNDKNDGRTEKTAFANPQSALNVAKPGDIILLMNGNYSGAENQPAVASFVSSGLPSAWITLKNYPGHQPVILCNGKDGVLIARGTQATQNNSPILAYLEIRGLTLKGNSEEVLRQNLPELGTSTPITETTGININGEYSPVRMYHHIRVADCIAEYCGADGIYADFTDYLTVENNILRYNCYTSAHWCMSGFTMMHYADFDKVDNVTKILVRGNQAYANQC